MNREEEMYELASCAAFDKSKELSQIGRKPNRDDLSDMFIAGALWADTHPKYSWISIEEKPHVGQKILAYHPSWIDEYSNPKGIRIGFWNGEDFTSARWWAHQDWHMTISHFECDDNPAFSENTKNNIEPELWIPLTYLTDSLPAI